jgi:hypothetical protein
MAASASRALRRLLSSSAAPSPKAFATTFPLGLTGPGATDAFFTAALDLSQPLLERGSGDFMAAARADARARLRLRKNSRASPEVEASVREHLADATALSERFKLSGEVHDCEKTRAQLEGSFKRTGRLALLLGGKSVGKSLLLGELARRTDIVGTDGRPRAVVYVDARVFGADLSAGMEEAFAEEVGEVKRSGFFWGPRRTQAEREGEVPAASLVKFAATSVAVKGSLGLLSVEGSAKLPAATGASTLQRNLAALTRVVAAHAAKGLYLCLIVDEANLALPMPPAPSAAAAAPLLPEAQRNLQETKQLLERLVQLTKQTSAINVLLVTSEYAYPYRLRHGGFFSPSNLSEVFIASEVPPASMRALLTAKWGLGPRLSDVLLAYCGGHVHLAANALALLSQQLDAFRVEELAPEGDLGDIAWCLKEGGGRHGGNVEEAGGQRLCSRGVRERRLRAGPGARQCGRPDWHLCSRAGPARRTAGRV